MGEVYGVGVGQRMPAIFCAKDRKASAALTAGEPRRSKEYCIRVQYQLVLYELNFMPGA